MPNTELDNAVAAVRQFSRFYTRRLGLLHEGLLGGPLTLPEGRLVYEIAHRGSCSAKDLCADLALDSGYLSRLLRGLEERGLIARTPSVDDARAIWLSLAPGGREVFAAIDARSRNEVGAMLADRSPSELRRLSAALDEAQALLSAAPRELGRAPFVIRAPRVGEMGWVVQRQSELYAREYGWDGTFEALAAEIATTFLKSRDPKREQGFVAEREGEPIGAVFLMRGSDEVGKLRMLFVEPSARGLGVGRRLVEECVRAARAARYRTLTLWTNDVLTSARRIYEAAGFALVAEQPHHSFGHDLVGQTWELTL